MAEQLLPCPHCGGPAEEANLYEGCPGWLVWCPECGVRVWRGMSDGKGPAIARAVWNQRTPGPATAAMLESAKTIATKARSMDQGQGFKPDVLEMVQELEAFIAEWPEPDTRGGA